jgi:hypothetical protein
MRLAVVLLTMACLAACSATPVSSDLVFTDQDARRQKQAILNADAIVQGMMQARRRAEQTARSAR